MRDYDFALYVASKNDARTIILGPNEATEYKNVSFFQLDDIYDFKPPKPSVIPHSNVYGLDAMPNNLAGLNFKETNGAPSVPYFRTKYNPNETDYAIGVQFVPKHVSRKAFEDLLYVNGLKPAYIKWRDEKKGEGYFVILYYQSRETAFRAKKTVLLIYIIDK